MFWGLVLEPGKRYSTIVDKSFHVSMAALDCPSVKSDSEILSVILESDGQENILCNLSKQHKLLQSHLDLNFMTGDKVAFEIKGNGIVHLSGYLVLEDDDSEYMKIPDYEEDEEELEVSPNKSDKNKQKGKRKDPPQSNEHKGKKLKLSEDSDEDSDEDDDEDDDDDDDEEEEATAVIEGADGSSDEDEEEDDDSDEEEDDDSEEDDSDEEEEESPVQSKKQKTPQSVNKKQQQTPNKLTPAKQQQSANKQNSVPLVNGSGPNQQSSNKKNKKKANQGQETPKTPIQNDVKTKNQKTPASEAGSPQQKKKLEGGVFVKDIKEGNGPVAKNGQMVSVFYQGRLKANNKMFDECKRGGAPFKFRLGKGEVIKGWDIGVSGMKVGGIRTITCPANTAYGQKGSPPQIPPNSALVFQVELKAVN